MLTAAFLALNVFPLINFGILARPRSAVLVGLVLGFCSLMLFLTFYTGKIGRYRRIFFISLAVGFAIHFVWFAIGDRGHMWSLDQDLLYSTVPMCHIAVPEMLLPILLKREIVFPGPLATSASKILMVLVIALVYGRTFCAWGCLLGGQDELFSSLPGKKRLVIKKLPPFLFFFPFALLLFVSLLSLATMSPAYCVWFCPFKTVGDYLEVNSGLRLFQTVSFVVVWLALVMVLPWLTRKRTQCAWFCPMGAFLSLFQKVNLFTVKIDREKCSGCQRCVQVCPTFSLTKESLEKGETLLTCSNCGLCIDACSSGAMSMGMKGVPFTASCHPLLAERTQVGFFRKLAADLIEPGVIFTFSIFWVATSIASPLLVDALSRLSKYFLGW